MSEKTETGIITIICVIGFLALFISSTEFQKDFENFQYAFVLGIPVTAIGWLIYKYLKQFKK